MNFRTIQLDTSANSLLTSRFTQYNDKDRNIHRITTRAAIKEPPAPMQPDLLSSQVMTEKQLWLTACFLSSVTRWLHLS